MSDLEKRVSLSEMSDFAKDIITDLEDTVVKTNTSTAGLLLYGDLGAGKTTLVQHIGRVLGIDEVISSPTFVLMKSYETTHTIFKRLVHIDAYRLKPDETNTISMLVDEISQPNTLVCVEWPDVLTAQLAELVPVITAVYVTSVSDAERQVLYKQYEQ